MSVIIKGLKMPKEGCKDCQLVARGLFYDVCPFLSRIVNGNVERGGKPYDCPLVELPDHGRLVDVDVMERMFLKATGVSISFNGVPTVIPAERSEDDA